MRVLVDARELEGLPTGVGRVLRGLIDAWPTGADRLLLATREPLPNPPDHADVELLPPRRFRRLPGILWEQLVLPRLVRRHAADVLLAPNYSMPLRSPVPTAVCMHDCAPFAVPSDFSGRERIRRQWGARVAARRAAFLFVGSNFAAEDARRHLGVDESRLLRVVWGLRARFEPPSEDRIRAVAERYGLDQGPTVLFLGSRLGRRRIDRLIRQTAELRRRFPDLTMVVAGTDPQHLAGGQSADHVRPLGFVPEPDLEPLLAAATVLAYPSTYEGFGLPVLEALACGTPVVASNTTALAEIYSGRADLVEHEDSAGWIEALGHRIEQQRIGADGRDLAAATRWAREQSWRPAAAAVRRRLHASRESEA